MATTKRQLAEQILRILHGGDISEDAQIDERELFINIDQVRAKLIKEEIVANKKSGILDISGDYISSYEDLTIVKDDKKNLYYSVIPVKYVILPDDIGLYQVSLMQGQESPFIRVANGTMGLFSGLHAFHLGGRVGYWVEKDRVYYHNFSDKLKDSKILLKLVASVEDFNPNEELPIPADRELELLQQVLQIYGVHTQVPQDKKNDNVK